MQTLFRNARLLLVLLPLSSGGCPEKIPTAYCPAGVAETESTSGKRGLVGFVANRDAAALLNDAEAAYQFVDQSFSERLDKQEDSKAELELGDRLLSYAIKVHEATLTTYSEVAATAQTPTSTSTPPAVMTLSRLRQHTKTRALTLKTYAKAMRRIAEHSALIPQGGTRPGEMARQTVLAALRKWSPTTVSVLTPAAIAATISRTLLPSAYADNSICYDSCNTQDWKSCLSCVQNMGDNMYQRWLRFCTDWNKCNDGLLCDAQRIEALAGLLLEIANAASAAGGG